MAAKKLGLEPLIDPTAQVRQATLGRYTAIGARTRTGARSQRGADACVFDVGVRTAAASARRHRSARDTEARGHRDADGASAHGARHSARASPGTGAAAPGLRAAHLPRTTTVAPSDVASAEAKARTEPEPEAATASVADPAPTSGAVVR
jgi:hypothetical protein